MYALEENGFEVNLSTGLLAPQVRNFCRRHATWKVGVLQSTQDIVMSTLFGRLTTLQHRVRVLGKQGIYRQTRDPSDNCSAWVPESTRHVFANTNHGWNKETWDGVSAGDFIRRLYRSDITGFQPSHH